VCERVTRWRWRKEGICALTDSFYTCIPPMGEFAGVPARIRIWELESDTKALVAVVVVVVAADRVEANDTDDGPSSPSSLPCGM
jgi:hypothetical protein